MQVMLVWPISLLLAVHSLMCRALGNVVQKFRLNPAQADVAARVAQ